METDKNLYVEHFLTIMYLKVKITSHQDPPYIAERLCLLILPLPFPAKLRYGLQFFCQNTDSGENKFTLHLISEKITVFKRISRKCTVLESR